MNGSSYALFGLAQAQNLYFSIDCEGEIQVREGLSVVSVLLLQLLRRVRYIDANRDESIYQLIQLPEYVVLQAVRETRGDRIRGRAVHVKCSELACWKRPITDVGVVHQLAVFHCSETGLNVNDVG